MNNKEKKFSIIYSSAKTKTLYEDIFSKLRPGALKKINFLNQEDIYLCYSLNCFSDINYQNLII